MDTSHIIDAINEEIARLEQARNLISGVTSPASLNGVSNAAKGQTRKTLVKAVAASAKPRRGISPEGRARIVAAQKLRWAAVKKANR